jgi:hypothetical protein
VAAEGAGDIDDPHAEMRRTDFVGDRDINYDRTTVLDDITRCYGRRRAPASLQEVRHPAGGSTLTMGGLGGARGALHVTFCAGGGPESAPRRPVPQRSSSTSPGRTTVAWPHPA